ncbi:hypothetical protein NMG60_11002124 [Bertholletia excelsa]
MLMDAVEAANIVFHRIRKFETEDVAFGLHAYLIMHYGSQDLIRFAFGPDNLIQDLIQKTKIHAGLASDSPPISPANPSPTSDIPFRVSNTFWEPQVNKFQRFESTHFPSAGYCNSFSEEFMLQKPTQCMGLDDPSEPVNSGITAFCRNCCQPEPMIAKSRAKVCHYFSKGFCKHGSNCRYFHGQTSLDSLSPVFTHVSNEIANDDPIFSAGSIERLELEITELVKSRRGHPVSIASLPMLYFEKYGKILQAEGYLTESQRHGKAGYSLTKLLARMRNSLCLIDRPHGQHAIILAEDAPKYLDTRFEKNDPGPIVSGSRQIYLTFPAESTFSEEDVSNYFNAFGPVQEVRIPCQQRRMFGFVTFVSADTVRRILAKGNPHYVCGARVLVKPYREKSKLVERKYPGKLEHSLCHNSNYADMDCEFHSRWGSSSVLGQQFLEDPELALDLHTRRLSELQLAEKSLANHSCLSELQLAKKTLANHSCFGYSLDELKASEAHSKFSSAEGFNYLLDVLNSGSTSDDNPKHEESNHIDQESNGPDLPESPFAPQFNVSKFV